MDGPEVTVQSPLQVLHPFRFLSGKIVALSKISGEVKKHAFSALIDVDELLASQKERGGRPQLILVVVWKVDDELFPRALDTGIRLSEKKRNQAPSLDPAGQVLHAGQSRDRWDKILTNGANMTNGSGLDTRASCQKGNPDPTFPNAPFSVVERFIRVAPLGAMVGAVEDIGLSGNPELVNL